MAEDTGGRLRHPHQQDPARRYRAPSHIRTRMPRALHPLSVRP